MPVVRTYSKTMSIAGLLVLGAASSASAQYAYVSDVGNGNIDRLDAITGAFVAPTPFITGSSGQGLTAVGNVIYTGKDKAILTFNHTTGAALGTFVSNTPDNILTVVTSHDKSVLYTTNYGSVNSYDLATGTVHHTGATPDAWGVDVAPDNSVYVANGWSSGNNTGVNSGVYKFSADLSSSSVIVAPGDHGLVRGSGLVFAKDGTFYVANVGDASNGISDFINHYQADGTYIDKLTDPSLNVVFGLAIGPDSNLYAVNLVGNCISRFDTSNDTFKDIFVGPHSGVTSFPKTLYFDESTAATPEPGSFALLSGLFSVGAFAVRRRSSRKK